MNALPLIQTLREAYQHPIAKAVLYLLAVSGVFIAGAFLDVGFDLIAIVSKADLFSVIAFYSSIIGGTVSVFWSILSGFLSEIWDENTSWKFPFECKREWLCDLVAFALMGIILFLLFDWIGDPNVLVKAHPIVIFIGLAIFSLAATALFILTEGAAKFAGGFFLVIFFALGAIWTQYQKSYAEPVEIVLKGDDKKLIARIFMPANNGLLVFEKGRDKPTYFSWSTIKEIRTIDIQGKANNKLTILESNP